ncbi:MAG: 30S ribosomal protein S16 [Patescibacteria group bacterium]
MLAIRLKRIGRKRQPLYRLVVSDKTRDMYGDHLETLGNYNPATKVATLQVERVKYWLDKGAQASATVHNLLVKEGVITAAKVRAIKITKNRQEKLAAAKKSADKTSQPAEAPAVAPETPLEKSET